MADRVLDSWNDGPAKQAILEYVASVNAPGKGFVSPADRIATFDNDGTLWVERPTPPQFDFLLRKWGQEAEANPTLAAKEP